jgi:hypothetical protein
VCSNRWDVVIMGEEVVKKLLGSEFIITMVFCQWKRPYL